MHRNSVPHSPLTIAALLTVALFAAPTGAAVLGTVVYTDGFQSGLDAKWTGAAIVGIATVSPAPDCTSTNGFCGTNYLRVAQGTATLTLTGLDPHTILQIDLDAFIMGSWDGNGNVAGTGPDRFLVRVATPPGTEVALDASFSNTAAWQSGNFQSYPDPFSSGTNNPEKTGALEAGTLGPCCVWDANPSFSNAVYRFADGGHTLAVPHTGSTAVIEFVNLANEACENECLGLDNVVVSTDAAPLPVPELSALAMMGAGLVVLTGFVVARRQR